MGMGTWLLSVVGVTVIGVLVELLLTDSPMSKFVRSIYAFFILFVIVSPLPSAIKNGVNSVSGGVALDTNLLAAINTQSAAAFQRNTEQALATAGFKNVIITIDHDATAQSLKINRVYVNAYGLVLEGGRTDIQIKNEIVKIVCLVCNVKEEAVEYNA